MTVSFKAPVKSAVVNNAFVSKQANDVKVGQLGLNKASEGNQIFSVQKSVNELFDVTGTGEGDPNAKNYNNNNYIADGDSHKTAIEKLDAQVKNNADTIGDHINEELDAHDASAISYDNTDSELSAVNVQDAIDEVELRLDTAEADIQAIEDSIGQANGIAPLNGSSKIDATYLPSYVDDVLEYADIASLPLVGEQGKIYVTIDTNKTYRWTGSVYVEISASPVTSVNSQTGVVTLDADDIAETATRYWSKKNNVANTMPLVTNDASENYSVGSQWYDAINDTLYICEDATIGAAVWQPISGAGGGVGSVDIMFADTFENTDIADYTITQPLASISAVSPLQGENSLLIAHDFNPDYYIERIISVDNKFKNKNVTFTLDVFSNAASGDLTLSVWDHTNTVQLLNSELIQPQDVDQTSAKRSFSFNIPSGANELRYRINVLFDSGKVSRVDNLVIELTQMSKLDTTIETPIITEWQSYVPSFQGFGTPTNIEFQWRRSGESVEVRGKFTSGTSTAIEARIGLPNNYISANSLIIPSIQVAGANGKFSAAGDVDVAALIEPSVNYFTFGRQSSGTIGLTKLVGSSMVGTGNTFSFVASSPIQGLTATETQSVSLVQTVLVQESDSVLNARGNAGQVITVDVTNIPFNLVSNNGSDIIFNGNSFQVATDNIYDISLGVCFAGGDTSREIWFYVDGLPNLQLCNRITTFNFHAAVNLKLEVGKVYSFRSRVNGGTLQVENNRHYLNITKQGSLKQLNVSENQKIEIPTSELRMEGASARGTGAETFTAKYTNIAKIRGDAFSLDNSNATIVTMKKKGRLNVSASIRTNTSAASITKNQAVNTAAPLASERMAAALVSTATAGIMSMHACFDVNIGDVIRVNAEATPTADSGNSLTLSFQEQEVAVSVTNVLPQFSESDSSVRVDTANGYGSTLNNKIRRFSAQRENLGSSVLYVDDPANGARFEIKENGIYHIAYTEYFATGDTVALSLNASSITSTASTLIVNANNEILAFTNVPTGNIGTVTWSGYLRSGDIVRPHTNGAAATDNDCVKFTISKVGKPNVTGVDVTPFAKIEYEVTQSSYLDQVLTVASPNRVTGNLTSNTNEGVFSYNATTGIYTLLKNATINLSFSAQDLAAIATIPAIYINSTLSALSHSQGLIDQWISVSYTGKHVAGTTFDFRTIQNSIKAQRISITATELRDAYQVIGGGVENTYSAIISSVPSIQTQSYPFIDSVTSGGTGVYNINLKAGFFPVIPSVSATSLDGNGRIAAVTSATTSLITVRTFNDAGTNTGSPFSILVQRQGSDYRTPSKAVGLPAQRVAVLKDVKANNTAGGSASTTYTARVLNTLQDPTGMVANASSFTGTGGANSSLILEAGKYKLVAKAPTFGTSDAGTNLGGRSRIRLYNVTDASTIAIGQFTQPAGGQSGNIAAMDNAELDCYFTLTSQKTLEIQHRFVTTTASSLGTPANFGEDEVYTVVTIEKIEE